MTSERMISTALWNVMVVIYGDSASLFFLKPTISDNLLLVICMHCLPVSSFCLIAKGCTRYWELKVLVVKRERERDDDVVVVSR